MAGTPGKKPPNARARDQRVQPDYTADEVEFMFACYRRMRVRGVRTLSPRDVLAVARSLGYSKVEGVGTAGAQRTGDTGE